MKLAENPLIRLTGPGYGGCQEKRYGTPFTWGNTSPICNDFFGQRG